MASRTYSFLNIIGTIVGPGGFVSIGNGVGAADEGITIAASDNINTMEVGADGAGQHSLHGDRSAKITVRVLKTSPVNAALMAMYNFQTASAASHGQNAINFTDSVRGDVVNCTQVAFAKAPDLSYGKTAGFNTWEFDAVSASRVLGGA